ncbi:MAG: VTC domain-containing protein [Candidatus Beckwithbacteria bacterium GW2011_GWB1_47_15]|uniref:VTC domain-containing protein n=1 Tax=Candidatus Beckwithbacteria bacterium GW2011_GWB1_47_15 TaxID=1618371 RepID=A0A0G1RU79_9BACT|nr:MAG: VTC domain-containing protein [Candidatus Beckwithbacteria bacterium GW2011_GWC1_49_16]KKU35675.1 MAG: VTC domain-containing protein [Candidatus Beckwithbacteria bacterium GW2011_GWA1_46_30]KKU60874.1 MAG: VTC domain-containing protein [Candidatus Beckwithbacteria bacterium GW2011_GWB1_47_15]KKU72234.1 MAG: VTC domain-containing protein [Candidatus Beckwithbacteria bacterium GW2011_GWA2_47_25]KKW05006.1 MAG: VTC domain-containing protein [Candidatus Beckwithbacteria bacterium GW2011_GWC
MIKTNFERQEYKYLLTPDQHRQVREFLLNRGLVPDSHSQKKPDASYYISTLYLDTPDYQAYWQKQYGVKDRVKYRLRTYSQKATASTPVFWEIKYKYGDFLTKERAQLRWDKTQKLLSSQDSLSSSNPQTESGTLDRFYHQLVAYRLQPAILVSYLRQPLIDPFYPNFRLTFDYQIQAVLSHDLFATPRLTQVIPDHAIMELKFSGRVPDYLTGVVKTFDLPRQSLSKYCLSLEACGIVAEEND